MVAKKLFISYRRDDSAGHAGRVHDRLEREFGHDLLFMDVDAIPLGVNFIKILREEVARCDVLLAYSAVARSAGCSKSFISHLLAGRKKTCTPRLAERIAESLEVPLEILFVPSHYAASRQNEGNQSGRRATTKPTAAA